MSVGWGLECRFGVGVGVDDGASSAAAGSAPIGRVHYYYHAKAALLDRVQYYAYAKAAPL